MAQASLRSFFETWDKRFDTEELDELRSLIAAALTKQRKHLDSENESYAGFTGADEHEFKSYQYHLEDRWNFTNEVQRLSDELAIVALFKQVELHVKRVVRKRFPLLDTSELFKVKFLKANLPFILTIPEFSAFDELRLINNSVKHEGKVSRQLSTAFPAWKEGDQFSSLGTTYDRLLPNIKIYVQSFVAACYAKAGTHKT